jgi:hypothetical protein
MITWHLSRTAMKAKTIPSLQTVLVLVFVMIINTVFQFNTFGQDLSSAQRKVGKAVQSCWDSWKEKNSEKLRSFCHKNHVHRGAISERLRVGPRQAIKIMQINVQ